MSGDSKEIIIREDEDDDRSIREKASEHGVDVGNYGKHDVPVPPEPEGDDIVADNVSAGIENLVPDVKFTPVKDHSSSDAELLKIKKELSEGNLSYEDDADTNEDDFAPLDDDNFSFANEDEPSDDDLRKVDEEENTYRRKRRRNFEDDDYDDLDFSRNDEDDYNDDDYRRNKDDYSYDDEDLDE